MTLDLTHADLCRLVCGTPGPYYPLMEEVTKLGLGSYTGGHLDGWRWHQYADSPYARNEGWARLSEERLWDLYQRILASWK